MSLKMNAKWRVSHNRQDGKKRVNYLLECYNKPIAFCNSPDVLCIMAKNSKYDIKIRKELRKYSDVQEKITEQNIIDLKILLHLNVMLVYMC